MSRGAPLRSESRAAIARELYAGRCRDKSEPPTPLGIKHFLNSVARLAAERRGDSRSLRLRSLQLGPRAGIVLARALAGTEIESIDLSDNPSLGDTGATALLPLLTSGQLRQLHLGACGLRAAFSTALLQALASAPLLPLTSLKLGGAPTGELSISTQLGASGSNRLPMLTALLGELRAHCPDLHELGLSHIALGEAPDLDKGVAALAALMSDNSVQLTSLDLSHNELYTPAIEPLVAALPASQHLRTLDLSHNPLGDTGVIVLASALSPSTYAAAAAAAEKATQVPPTIKPRAAIPATEATTRTRCGASAGRLSSGILHPPARMAAEARLDAAVASIDVTTANSESLLRMHHSPPRVWPAVRPMSSPRDRPPPSIVARARPQSSAPAGRGAAAVAALVQPVKPTPALAPSGSLPPAARLESLCLNAIGLGRNGAMELGRALGAADCVLRSLDVSDNPGMGDIGVAALCRGVACSRVTSFAIAGCSMNDRGAAALGAALRGLNCRIQSIRLQRNPLGDPGAVALAAALVRNTSLRSLDASKANIGDEGAVAICLSLQRNSTLQKLRLDQNLISAEGGEAMLRELRVALAPQKATTVGGGGSGALRSCLEHLSVSGNSLSFSVLREMKSLCETNRQRMSVPPNLEREIDELAPSAPALDSAHSELAAIEARAADVTAEIATLEANIRSVRARSDAISVGGRDALKMHEEALAKFEAVRAATRAEREHEQAKFESERDQVQARVRAEQERARGADATAAALPEQAEEQMDEAIAELMKLDLALAANGARIEHARARRVWAEASIDAINVAAAAHYAAEAQKAAEAAAPGPVSSKGRTSAHKGGKKS